MSDEPISFRFFEPTDDYCVTQRQDLPHWAQSGTVCFITWRTWDSIPRAVLNTWLADRDNWLIRHGMDPTPGEWRQQIQRLSPALQGEFRRTLSTRWEFQLDECHGACVLRDRGLARIVADSLHYFDGDRYVITDFVVMPNHVHLLAAFPNTDEMLKQCSSWKHYTAVQINRLLGRQGRFWESDSFDHLVRSPEQFDYLRKYIAHNPRHAGLSECQFIHYSLDLARP